MCVCLTILKVNDQILTFCLCSVELIELHPFCFVRSTRDSISLSLSWGGSHSSHMDQDHFHAEFSVILSYWELERSFGRLEFVGNLQENWNKWRWRGRHQDCRGTHQGRRGRQWAKYMGKSKNTSYRFCSRQNFARPSMEMQFQKE